jgi:HEAT repeat protein
LIATLKDQDATVRRSAAFALARIGPEAKEAAPALIVALKDQDAAVRRSAAEALGQIATALFDTRSTESLVQLKAAYEALGVHPDSEVKKQAIRVKRTIDYFESLWWVEARNRAIKAISDHPYISLAITAYLLLQLTWLLFFWLRPLSLLKVIISLSKTGEKYKIPKFEIPIPLKTALVFPVFHYRPRLLDAWVRYHLVISRENFAKKQTVAQRKVYVTMPALIDEQMRESISAAALQPIFDKKKATLLIAGEGGAGKTSLACQMATWAMADEPVHQLCRTHQMLPVLVEANLEPRTDNKDMLVETVRGSLRELIGEPEPIFEELLLHLLRKRRVLVIVDSLSELDETTRKSVRPASADFPVAALVVTSRIDETLGGASKTPLRLLRLKSDRLSTFMDRYLEHLGKRELFKDKEYFDECSRLSDIVSDRDITVLIAKMYAEQMVAAKEADAGARASGHDMPRNLPDLMLGYVNNLNEQVKAERQDIDKVIRVSKVVAWECLKHTCRPTTVKRADVLKALINEADAETLLKYLSGRLHLIQTAGPISDLVRFSLDPLAEYLAALYLVERCREFEDLWKEFFDIAEKQPGAPETIKGFLLAVRDCCLEKGIGYNVPEWVGNKLAQLAGLDEEAIKTVLLRQRIKLLLANMSSPDDGDQIRASVALGQIGPEATEAAPALISALKNSNANVSVAAAAALRRIGQGGKETVPVLIAALNDRDGFIRQCAAETLGEFGQEAKEAEPALIAALNDRDAWVRRAVLKAIMKINPADERAVPVIIEKLEDEDESVREYAAKALANFKSAVELTVPALANALVDPAGTVTIQVIFTLSDLGPPAVKAFPALIEVLENHRNVDIRVAAINALAAIGSVTEEVVLSLTKAKNDKNGRVRQSAKVALSTLNKRSG